MALHKVPIFEEVPLKAFIIVAVTYCLRLTFSTVPAPVGTPRAACHTTSKWIWGGSPRRPHSGQSVPILHHRAAQKCS